MTKKLKVCESCGMEFYKGETYNVVVFFLLIIFVFPLGVCYWYMNRKQKCPRCDSKKWHLVIKRTD